MKADSGYPQLEGYFSHLRIRGVKEATIERYRAYAVSTFRKMESLGSTIDLTTMRPEDVYPALYSMGLEESSQEAYAFLIRAACEFHGNRGMAGLRVLTNGNRPNVRWITDEEFSLLMDTDDLLDKLLIHLGGDYGLRRGEMEKLTVGDIKPGYMVVHGKGHGRTGRIRYVPLVEKKDPIIEMWLMHRSMRVSRCKEDLTDGRLIFWSDHGVLKPIRAEGIGRRIKRAMNDAGIDATSHSLRREFITSAHNAGCSVVDIMKVVGHTSPAVTMRYISNDIDVLRCVVTSRNEYIQNKGCSVVEDEGGSQLARI